MQIAFNAEWRVALVGRVRRKTSPAVVEYFVYTYF